MNQPRQRATSVQLGDTGKWMWIAVMNDTEVRHITDDPHLIAYVKPILNDQAIGAELVDADGTQLTAQWRVR